MPGPVLHLGNALMKAIADSAERAYPREACGLLVGRREGADVHVTGAFESGNVAPPGRPDLFEIDPGLRLRLQREARSRGEAIVGHWHSHPDAPPRPSATDLARAWERDLLWLIVGVVGGQAVRMTAHVLRPDGTGFDPVPFADEAAAGVEGPARMLDDLGRVGSPEK